MEPWALRPGTGPTTAVTSKPFTLTGLSANTTYEVYVRSDCGSGNLSTFAGPYTFTTECQFSLPFSEDFDGTGWVAGTATNSSGGTLGTCWSRTPAPATNIFYWKVRTDGTGSPSTGPLSDHTSGSGNYMHTEASGSDSADVALFETVDIDVSGVSSIMVTYWYHMHGDSTGRLAVDAEIGGNWVPQDSLVGEQQANQNDAWQLRQVIIPVSGSTVKVRFRGVRGNDFTSDIAIDDITVQETPTCLPPSGLAATPFITSANLSWTENNSATSWTVEYGVPGFTLGTGTQVTAGSNPFTLTGLTASIDYEYYVQSDCGGSDLSTFSGPVAFSTECTAEALPFVTDFESGWSGKTPATCWFLEDQIPQAATFGWTTNSGATSSATTGPSVDHTQGNLAGKYIYVEGNGAFIESRSLLTTPFTDVSSVSSVNVEFWYHMFGGGTGTLMVEGYVNGSWTKLDSIVGQQQLSSTDPWLKRVIVVPVTGSLFKVRFTGSIGTTTASDIAIDDVIVKESPNCLAPSAITATSMATSAMIDWTESSGATDWILEYGPTGYPQGNTTFGTTVNVSSKPFNLTGLTAETTYDVYLKADCGGGNESDLAPVFTFTTACNTFTLPYMESFDGSDWPEGQISACWTNNGTAPFLWRTRSGGSPTGTTTGPSNDHTQGNASGKYIFSVGSTNNGIDGEQTTIESTPIDISGISSVDVTFWYHMFGDNIDRLVVDAFINGSWMPVDSIVGEQQTSTTDAWKEATVRTAVSGSAMKVRFRAVREGSGIAADNADIAIDDLLIEETPSCIKPENLTATTIISTSAILNWAEVKHSHQLADRIRSRRLYAGNGYQGGDKR